MSVKGYIRYKEDVSELYETIGRLISSGVSSEEIVMAENPAQAIAGLQAGDRLLVYSLYELANGLPSLMRLLGTVAQREAVVKSLDEPWLDMESAHVDWPKFFEGLALFGSKAVGARTKQGLTQAARNGSKLGRPAGPSPGMAVKYQEGLKRYKEGGTLSGIAQELGFNRICFAKWMDENYPGLRKRNAKRKQS